MCRVTTRKVYAVESKTRAWGLMTKKHGLKQNFSFGHRILRLAAFLLCECSRCFQKFQYQPWVNTSVSIILLPFIRAAFPPWYHTMYRSCFSRIRRAAALLGGHCTKALSLGGGESVRQFMFNIFVTVTCPQFYYFLFFALWLLTFFRVRGAVFPEK